MVNALAWLVAHAAGLMRPVKVFGHIGRSLVRQFGIVTFKNAARPVSGVLRRLENLSSSPARRLVRNLPAPLAVARAPCSSA